jgi:hypothetical protein
MKNSVDMVRSSIKELTNQVARDRKWRRSMDERLDKMLVMQEGWQMRESEKTTESLQMAMNREARKKKITVGKGNDDNEEDEYSDADGGPMGELWLWEQCYHRCGYQIVLTKIVHILQPYLPTTGRTRLKIKTKLLGRPKRRCACLNVLELTEKY